MVAHTKKNKNASAERMLTMQDAMQYLTERGIPCRSRSTFYRLLRDFRIEYVNINPNGKHEIRRFTITELDKVLG